MKARSLTSLILIVALGGACNDTHSGSALPWDGWTPPEEDAGGTDVPVVPVKGGVIGLGCSSEGELALRVVLSDEASCKVGAVNQVTDGLIATVPRDAVSSTPTSVETSIAVCEQGQCLNERGSLTFESWDDVAGATGRWTVELLDGSELGGEFRAAPCDWQAPGGEVPIDDADITAVTLFQAVRIPLMEGGQPIIERSAPVVANRDATFRIYVQPHEDFASRSIIARLTLGSDDDPELHSFSESKIPYQEPQLDVLMTTFNIKVPGDAMEPGLAWSVGLFEQADCKIPGAQGTRWPATGQEPLEADVGGPLEIVLVPVRYEADGSNRLPDVSPEHVEHYHDRMTVQYPASEILMSVREDGGWPEPVMANGEGWDMLLQAVMYLRYQDGAPEHVYYYGLVNPAPTMEEFCGFACVAGLSTQTGVWMDGARASVGLGYYENAGSTMVHELGHAHGRPHSPCGTQDAPPSFPYPDGDIGVWGYDPTAKKLLDPAKYKDVMGYCEPTWVSDFTYRKLFNRIQIVNLSAHVVSAEGRQLWRMLLLDGQGGARWGNPIAAWNMGPRLVAQALDADGEFVTKVELLVSPMGDHGGQLALVPELEPGWMQLLLPDGQTVPVSGLEEVPALIR